MTITVERVTSYKEDHPRCDSVSRCDPYVKIFVNDKKVHETTRKVNDHVAVFMETYVTEQIDHADKIRLEVWDSDNFLNGVDDHLLSTEISADNYETFQVNSGSGVTLETHIVWKPVHSIDAYNYFEIGGSESIAAAIDIRGSFE